jgi:ABC-type amino acid transport substrate-binding protein
MRRTSWIILSFLLISASLAACSSGRGGAATPAKSDKGLAAGSLKIGTDANLAPFETLDMSNNRLGGFDIELIQAIAKQAGLDLTFFNVPANQVLAGVAQCQYEAGISAIPITDELRQYMLFSEPYYTAGHVVVVKEGNLTIAGREDLAGKTVGVAAGSPAATEILNIPGAQAKVYDSSSLAFQDLINGYIQAVIEDAPHALTYVAIKANNLKIVGDEFSNVQYGIAICKKRPDLLKTINDGLAAIQSEGTFDKLTKKWNLESGQ